jgi:GAF domain-containing protein
MSDVNTAGATLLAYLDEQAARPTDDWPAVLAQSVRMLAADWVHFDWTGIYLVAGDELVLGPFVGRPTEHERIAIGSGICGAAAAERATIVVDDVAADPRYLACFASTRSEIVVPILDGERVIGEIDVDSDRPAAFGPADAAYLAEVAARLARLAPAGHGRPA